MSNIMEEYYKEKYEECRDRLDDSRKSFKFLRKFFTGEADGHDYIILSIASMLLAHLTLAACLIGVDVRDNMYREAYQEGRKAGHDEAQRAWRYEQRLGRDIAEVTMLEGTVQALHATVPAKSGNIEQYSAHQLRLQSTQKALIRARMRFHAQRRGIHTSANRLGLSYAGRACGRAPSTHEPLALSCVERPLVLDSATMATSSKPVFSSHAARLPESGPFVKTSGLNRIVNNHGYQPISSTLELTSPGSFKLAERPHVSSSTIAEMVTTPSQVKPLIGNVGCLVKQTRVSGGARVLSASKKLLRR